MDPILKAYYELANINQKDGETAPMNVELLRRAFIMAGHEDPIESDNQLIELK